jgi:hypothetical protein
MDYPKDILVLADSIGSNARMFVVGWVRHCKTITKDACCGRDDALY